MMFFENGNNLHCFERVQNYINKLIKRFFPNDNRKI